MRVVLYRPQIPQNTGNVARSCAVTGAELVLVEPLGFKMEDRWLKRAGLDYWQDVKWRLTGDLLGELQGDFYLLSSKAKRSYTEVDYSPNATLVFGSETEGLPEELLADHQNRSLTIPMLPNARCLNLATSVGIVLYEAIRQTGFKKAFAS